MTHLSVGGSDYHLMFGLRTRELGFQIFLKDFMMDKDPSHGMEKDHLIQMNEPLKYRGFKAYQSSYRVEPGKPDISIFTVARDPGNPLKYAGAIIMVLGILALFYTKKFSTLKTSDPKLRSR